MGDDAEFREKGLAASRARDSHADKLKQTYGLSTADYNAMLRQQNGACAICRQKSAERLCVDHCHKTRRVRGLLCRKCNTGLGCYGDDPERIAAAIAYLQARGGNAGRAKDQARAGKNAGHPAALPCTGRSHLPATRGRHCAILQSAAIGSLLSTAAEGSRSCCCCCRRRPRNDGV
jgi:hypothetical protein